MVKYRAVACVARRRGRNQWVNQALHARDFVLATSQIGQVKKGNNGLRPLQSLSLPFFFLSLIIVGIKGWISAANWHYKWHMKMGIP